MMLHLRIMLNDNYLHHYLIIFIFVSPLKFSSVCVNTKQRENKGGRNGKQNQTDGAGIEGRL
ncbi:MAG: hypothetical protein WAX69_09290, partial [Victivallales bacterium]